MVPTIRILEDRDALVRAAADLLLDLWAVPGPGSGSAPDRAGQRTATEAPDTDAKNAGGHRLVALSGGSTPLALYEDLRRRDAATARTLARAHLFWSDERCVPLAHERSNAGAALRTWLEPVDFPKSHIHPPPVSLPPAEAAASYEEALRAVAGGLPEGLRPDGRPAFDLIFLGMGDDGHTASLFPGTAVLEERRALVAPNEAPHLPEPRITFTYPLLGAAKRVVFLVSGRGKAETAQAILEAGDNAPAGRVEAERGAVLWLLDRDAASQLAQPPAAV